MKTIDMTPTWEGVLPIYIAGIQSGSFEGIKTATEELRRMARLADITVAAQKDRSIEWASENSPPKWERPLLLALIKQILNRGFGVSIDLEGEPLLQYSVDLDEIIQNLASGDCEEVFIRTKDKIHGWFSLIYNNGSEHDPMAVISDYSDNDLCNEIISDIEEGITS